VFGLPPSEIRVLVDNVDSSEFSNECYIPHIPWVDEEVVE